jgi:hypothetical protein
VVSGVLKLLDEDPAGALGNLRHQGVTRRQVGPRIQSIDAPTLPFKTSGALFLIIVDTADYAIGVNTLKQDQNNIIQLAASTES